MSDKKRSSPLSPCAKGLVVGTFSLSLIAVGLLVGFMSNGNENGGVATGTESNLRNNVDLEATTQTTTNTVPVPPIADPVSDAAAPVPSPPAEVPASSVAEIAAVAAAAPVEVEPTTTAARPFCGPDTPACANVDVRIVYDDRSDESSYDIRRVIEHHGGDGYDDDDDLLVASYVPGPRVWDHSETYCLTQGRYEFTMYDTALNGIKGWLGDGHYEVSTYGEVIAEGSEWRTVNETTAFEVTTDHRYDEALAVIVDSNEVTSPEIIDEEGSPQNEALRWIACRDQISAASFHDVAAAAKEPASDGGDNGVFESAGGASDDAGESSSQMLRRYALAVLYFATSENGPWTDSMNFLTEDRHECSWHVNVTTTGEEGDDEFDLAGMVCTRPGETMEIVVDDAETDIGDMTLNIRVPNNLVGTIPQELGRVPGMTGIVIENQSGLRGPIPSALEGMANLTTLSILFEDGNGE